MCVGKPPIIHRPEAAETQRAGTPAEVVTSTWGFGLPAEAVSAGLESLAAGAQGEQKTLVKVVSFG